MDKVKRGFNPPPKEDCPAPPPFPSSGSSACCGADATHSGLVSPRCGDGLLPCPLCGESVKLEEECTEGYDDENETEYHKWYHHIECKCGLSLTNYNKDINVRETWNTRKGNEVAK